MNKLSGLFLIFCTASAVSLRPQNSQLRSTEQVWAQTDYTNESIDGLAIQIKSLLAERNNLAQMMGSDNSDTIPQDQVNKAYKGITEKLI